MRLLIKKLVFLSLVFALSNVTYAKSKVAHINTQELLRSMPEMKAANMEFNQFQQTLKTNIQKSMTEYRNKITKYSNEASTKTDSENAFRQKELKDLEVKIQESQIAAQKQSDQEYIKLTKPVKERALSSIRKIGKKLGFDYVLDSSEGSNLLLANGTDLMNAVKKELKIK